MRIDVDPFDVLIFAPEKAVQGAACNGCGRCCLAQRCPISELMFGASDDTCPALEFEGRRYVCGLIAHGSRYFGMDLRDPIAALERLKVLVSAAAAALRTNTICEFGDGWVQNRLVMRQRARGRGGET